MKNIMKIAFCATFITGSIRMQAMEQASWLSQVKSASMALLKKSLGCSFDTVKKIDRQTIQENKTTIALGTAAVVSTGVFAYVTHWFYKRKIAQRGIVAADANIKRYTQAYSEAVQACEKCENEWATYEKQGIEKPTYVEVDGLSAHRNKQIFLQKIASLKQNYPDAHVCFIKLLKAKEKKYISEGFHKDSVRNLMIHMKTLGRL